jgi:thioredoxin-like negative regulator of GroEL
MSAEDRIKALEAKLEEAQARLEAMDPRPKIAEPTNIDVVLKLALEKAHGDAKAATELFWAWMQQSSEIRDSLKSLVREAVEARLKVVNR